MSETAAELDAVLQRLLAGALPVEEIVCEILDLIEDEGATAAFSAVWADQLLGEAKGLDRRAKEGEQYGLLHGVPFAVDGAVSVAKGLDELGVQRVRSADRGRDAALLEPLRAAGGLVLGRAIEGPLARWQSLPGVLGVPQDSLRGGHFTPTRGLVSPAGLTLNRPSFDVPSWTASSLDLIARCAAALGVAPYVPTAEAPVVLASPPAAAAFGTPLVVEQPSPVSESLSREWLDSTASLRVFEAQVAAVALDEVSERHQVREAYDVLTAVRERFEAVLSAGVFTCFRDELPWQTLGLPVLRLGEFVVLGRRFEDAAVLAGAWALERSREARGNERGGSSS